MNKPVFILGINCVYHESSACILKDGELLAAVEEERFNRIKHAKPANIDNSDELPEESIKYCLKVAGLDDISAVDFVGYSLEPEEHLRKNLAHEHTYPIPAGDFGTEEGEWVFYQKNLDVEKKIRSMGFDGRFFYLDHHDCHAASAFYVSGYDEAAVMVIDGIGEFESSTFYKGEGINMKKIRHFEYPHSLGFLWEKISGFLGFSVYDASKAMGLSSYGQASSYQDKLAKLIQVDDSGAFVIDDDLVQHRNDNYEHLEQVFGVPKLDEPVSEVTPENQKYADIALAMQLVTEDIFKKLAKFLQRETDTKYLCMAGGVTLNCVANGYLSYENAFENIYVQPAANDAGTAIGAAFLIWHQKLGKPRQAANKSPYIGPEFTNDEIQVALGEYELNYKKQTDVASTTAHLLADGNVIAWFQGRMEIGPRALGNRSLLADPRRADVTEMMNVKVKHREAFRPFCPSVLAEKADEWFELPEPMPAVADYMLGAFRARKEKAEEIPAVVHFDGTSRIQAVRSDTNPRFHQLLTEMEKRTGVPVLLNTSFNDQEPIVCTPEDAVKTFLKTHIDYLVIGDFIASKNKNDALFH